MQILVMLKRVSLLVILFCIAVYIHYVRKNLKTPAAESPVPEDSQVTKNILLWNTFFGRPAFNFGFGNKPFIERKCKISNCFVTNKRDLIPIEKFDAIVFHGPEYYPTRKEDYPQKRSPLQMYAFYSHESPARRSPPVYLNGFFNITMTYRFDSDIYFPYFSICDKGNHLIAPLPNPEWKTPVLNQKHVQQFSYIYTNKTKPAAWFVSNCKSNNKREELVRKLQEYIKVDVFGKCGTMSCLKANNSECFDMLKNDYFFYLSFENSNCKDYVTEKVMNALKNDVVPVVYGGADYKKFLPPHSYIDAREYSPLELSKKLYYLMENPSKYVEYFWWKSFYSTKGCYFSSFCLLCELLHNRKYFNHSYNITEWMIGIPENPICFDDLVID